MEVGLRKEASTDNHLWRTSRSASSLSHDTSGAVFVEACCESVEPRLLRIQRLLLVRLTSICIGPKSE